MDESIIYRYLNGELGEKECLELLDWVNANETNRRIFSEIKNAWTAVAKPEQMTRAELKKEFGRLTARIANKDNLSGSVSIKAKTKHSIGYYLLRIAAVLLFIYGTGITYIYLDDNYNQEFYDIYTRRGEKSQLVLSDGTKIWINSDSHLRYPTSMDKRKVIVQLEGEAYFDVAKMKSRKFVVRTSDVDITALGTSFNVKSYQEEGTVETTLEEGKIQITDAKGAENLRKSLVILPNQRVTIYTNPEAEIRPAETDESEGADRVRIEEIESTDVFIQNQANTSIYTSWKDGLLQFRKVRFEDLALLLERWYDISIEINDEAIRDWRYTGTFDKETIEQALHALSMSMPFSYTVVKNQVAINK